MIPDQALVPIRDSVIGSLTVPSVNARDLHRAIGSKRQFSNWIGDRIQKYGFTQGVDFIAFMDNSKANHITTKEYMLTLDTAKELAMVESTSQGRMVRRYFIELERRYLSERAASTLLPSQVGQMPSVLEYSRVTSLDLEHIASRIAQVMKKASGQNRRCVVARQIWSDLWQIAGGRRGNRRLLPSERMPQYLSYLADREHCESDRNAHQVAQASVSAILHSSRQSDDLPLPDVAADFGMSSEALAILLCEVDVCDKHGVLGKNYTNGRMFKQKGDAPIAVTRQGVIWLGELLHSRSHKKPQQLTLLAN